jgi:hypothetical protein
VPVTITLVPTLPEEGLRVILGVGIGYACTVGVVDAMRKMMVIASKEIATAVRATYFLFIFFFFLFLFYNVIILIGYLYTVFAI